MKSHRWYTPWLLVLPAMLWVIVFGLGPFLYTIFLSFTDARAMTKPGAYQLVGFTNYSKLFGDELFHNALLTTGIYVVACVPALTILPLLLALLVEKKIPGITFFRTTFYFPVIASVVVVGLIWSWMFDSRGIINQTLDFLTFVHAPVPFLVDRWLLLACAIMLTVWKGLGYYMVVYLAALANVGPELHEAAAIDGASGWQRFLHVTLPGVRGAMTLVMALITVAAMRIFSELYVLSNGTGGPGGQDLSIVMLVQQVGKGLAGRLGYASAISVVLFFLTLGPLALVGWLNSDRSQKKATA